MILDIDLLIDKAIEASKKAYAKYSNFNVGCAILADDKIYQGANIENASYGLSMCAERVAIGNCLVNSDIKKIKAIAIYASTKLPISPCGACRQVLLEFLTKDIPIILVSKDRTYKITNVEELLPFSFNSCEYLDA